MAADYAFSEDELVVDQGLGYPKAYAKLCRDRHSSPYIHGPPFTFTPYLLQPQEAVRASDLDEMFPIINPRAKPTTKPKIFVGLLWKQLNHLGNAGFDPAIFRIDPYGNVLYYHADPASPLAWEIDHWFPPSRGGSTVPSNLRILQWRVCKKKHNKLEFLVPWWDLQLGISINHFLSFFASSNSDFRHRAFSFLFPEGENEELSAAQIVDSHTFPQHFIESKEKVGLAPAAIVLSRRESYDTSPALTSLDVNRRPRPNSLIVASRILKPSISKENENPDMITNPYQAIVMARDSLKQREDTLKMQAEIQKLDEEVNQLKQKNEEERLTIQDLELVLIKRRRRVEKCRRLAETQSSYRTMLEKMIRDAMHQSVIYKEQVRLNQAATTALTARLEAQKAICDASEKELHKKFKQRDDIEKQIRPEYGQARKRSRMGDTDIEENENKTVLLLPGIEPNMPLHKELRVFLEEEQRASESGLSFNEDWKQKEKEEKIKDLVVHTSGKEHQNDNSIVAVNDNVPIEEKLQALEIGEEKKYYIQFPDPKGEEDEECRKQRGKGNVEKWLQMLLENAQDGLEPESQDATEHETSKADEIIKKLNHKYPHDEIRILRFPESESREGAEQQVHKDNMRHAIEKNYNKKGKEENAELESRETTEKHNAIEVGSSGKGVDSCNSFEGNERRGQSGKERKLVRSESERAFRRIPSSPSIILGMRKGVDCIGKKPVVSGEDDEGVEDRVPGNNFIKSSIKTIKKAVRI
ncbi:uncharacterized protein LOC131157601 [Malania oleifera]|uniref:uncharacterized protein LOC131157601 n=1 Tax=Malania oleifera TaxID=397392 RepID=UPI0025ADD4CC|nr:uncharacterized protein LOC131157601 [Malania oleifera]